MRKKKAITKLPDWFSLEKYYGSDLKREMHKMGLEDWLYQISRRLGAECEKDEEERREKFEKIWDKPLELRTEKETLESDSQKYRWNVGGVRIATHITRGVLNRLWENKTKKSNIIMRSNCPLELLYEPDEQLSILPSRTVLTINLKESDKRLIEEFSTMLKLLRIKEPWSNIKPAKFTGINEGFFNYGSLPYWDLKSWMKEKQVKITYEELGKRILPDRELNGEEVRKTTKKWADQIFSWEFLRALRAADVLLKNKIKIERQSKK